MEKKVKNETETETEKYFATEITLVLVRLQEEHSDPTVPKNVTSGITWEMFAS